MNTDSIIPDEDDPAQPIVQWYPRGGALRSVPPDLVTLGVLALGVFVVSAAAYAGVALARGLLADED